MIQDKGKKLTPKQYLKKHPEKYLLTGTADNGIKVHVCEPPAGLGLFAVGLTTVPKDAIVWGSLDNTPAKQQWHIAKTGIKDLNFIEIISLAQE